MKILLKSKHFSISEFFFGIARNPREPLSEFLSYPSLFMEICYERLRKKCSEILQRNKI